MGRETPYAGLVTRGLAFVLDVFIINLALALLAALVALALSLIDTFSALSVPTVVVAGVAVQAVLGATYFTWFWVLAGQTPGMWWMRIVVERADGGGLGWRRALARLVGLVLASAPAFLGFLPILFTKRRRGLADLIAGTVVRYRREERDLPGRERPAEVPASPGQGGLTRLAAPPG